MKRAIALLSIGLAGFCVADDAAPKIQYFSAAQLASQVAHPVEGVAAKQFLNGSGSDVYIIHRDKNGEAEVHMAFNDIYVVKSGHAKITVGGQVSGNRETATGEWRGGNITGGTDYPLAAGDVLFIPAGVPHKVLVAPKASITYVTVKTPK
jgi:mannose-6-phosphate isomerase-like protein (cupin superfamily)